MTEVVSIKIISLVILIVVTLFFSLLPVTFLSRITITDTKPKLIISALNCFSAGVFLGTALLDLLPEVRVVFNEICNEAADLNQFPIAEFTTALGVFLIILVEQCLVSHTENKRDQVTELETYLQVPQVSDSEMKTANNSMYIHDSEIGEKQNVKLKLRFLVLLLAISVHSTFEGLAIGLQRDTRSIWSLLFGVSIHKAIFSFTLGIDASQSTLSLTKVVICLTTYSLMSPLGIFIGIITTGAVSSFSANLTNAILQGIATGTFFYLTFIEMLAKELQNNPCILNLIWIALGFAGPTLLTLLE